MSISIGSEHCSTLPPQLLRVESQDSTFLNEMKLALYSESGPQVAFICYCRSSTTNRAIKWSCSQRNREGRVSVETRELPLVSPGV